MEKERTQLERSTVALLHERPFQRGNRSQLETATAYIIYKQEQQQRRNELFKRTLGITYDEFDKLDETEQQRLIEQKRRKNKKSRDIVMIGSGEDAIFVSKKGKYMLEDGTVVRVGTTPEEYRDRLEDRFDDMIYSKPVAFVKKLIRRIKNKR